MDRNRTQFFAPTLGAVLATTASILTVGKKVIVSSEYRKHTPLRTRIVARAIESGSSFLNMNFTFGAAAHQPAAHARC